jgi:hypothetical protein
MQGNVARKRGPGSESKKKRLLRPGFPVKHVGVGELHAAFRNESRTRRHIQCSEQEIRGQSRRFFLFADAFYEGL